MNTVSTGFPWSHFATTSFNVITHVAAWLAWHWFHTLNSNDLSEGFLSADSHAPCEQKRHHWGKKSVNRTSTEDSSYSRISKWWHCPCGHSSLPTSHLTITPFSLCDWEWRSVTAYQTRSWLCVLKGAVHLHYKKKQHFVSVLSSHADSFGLALPAVFFGTNFFFFYQRESLWDCWECVLWIIQSVWSDTLL